jgi:hypothetical protein
MSVVPGSDPRAKAGRGGQGSRAGVFLPQLSTWIRQSAAGVLCLAAVLALNVGIGELETGNAWSLWYGSVATFLMVVAALLSPRRRMQRLATRLRLGSARAWLDVHLAGGILFLLLVLMHSSFRWPTSILGLLLLGLAVWTVGSGIVGLMIQQWVPKVLASGLSVEVLYQRAGELVDNLRRRAEQLAVQSGPPVATLYESAVAARLERLEPRWVYLFDITGGQQSWMRGFEHLGSRVDDEARVALDELERLLRAKIEIDASYSLQRALRWWIWLHVPTSILLLAAVALHIGANLYY